jgi:hypothetical protein
LVLVLLFATLAAAPVARAAEPAPKVYVILWFDTEDYLLPADDDAALHLANFLTAENIRATFKVVGEKARVLERRKRQDVIDALKKHEIGFHAQWHSVQPTPALYLSNLDWDEGVAEFDRREGPGRDDVQRVFGVAPTCYGQPGSSWGPQSYGAMKKWGMQVYLDAGSHVDMDKKPHFYCGLLNLYRLAYTPRTGLSNKKELDEAEEQFSGIRKKVVAEGGGVVSIYYHPCEFVHKEFWDGVNFRNGANPPREEWKLPKQKTEEETKTAYENFEAYIRFMKRFPEVKFITASDAVKLYRDDARDHDFTADDIKAIADNVGEGVGHQRHKDYNLTASEVFYLLNEYLAARTQGRNPEKVRLTSTPLGPTSKVTTLAEPVATDWSQFSRTSVDVADFLKKQGRVPSAVWLGSVAVPPAAYLQSLARVVLDVQAGTTPKEIEIKSAQLLDAKYVADDDPKKLWGWIIFPPGFRAPALMDLARKQAWTLKPATLHAENTDQ